jgi:hypothetical protein
MSLDHRFCQKFGGSAPVSKLTPPGIFIANKKDGMALWNFCVEPYGDGPVVGERD